jgi:hypothetical protein
MGGRREFVSHLKNQDRQKVRPRVDLTAARLDLLAPFSEVVVVNTLGALVEGSAGYTFKHPRARV